MANSNLAFTESSTKELLLEWDKNNPDKKRVAWKITMSSNIFYAIIEYIDKKDWKEG